MENLIGDNIVTSSRKKEKGVEKSIYFAEIDCSNFEQYGLYGNRKVDLNSILNKVFSINNENYDEKNKVFIFDFENKNYVFNIIELTDDYFFGQLSTEKLYNDILQEYKDKDQKVIKSIIIKSFTFFYIDINKKYLVYIGHKDLKNFNKILSKYFEKYGKESIKITFYGNNNLLKKIEKSPKLQSIAFQIADNGEISKSLDKTLEWDRNINNFIINIKIKHPTKLYIKQIISDNNKHRKISKPVLKFQDETFNDYISHLFENYFTVKEKIFIGQVDLNGFGNIKEKLINATSKFME